MSKNLWIKQLDYISGPPGSYPKYLMQDASRLDRLLGKSSIRETEKLVVVFLGQSLYFRQAGIEHNFLDVTCRFVSYTHGEDPSVALKKLHELNPEIVIVFRPELFAEFESFFEERIAVGYFTEPLPSKMTTESEDLEARYDFLIHSFPNMMNVFDLFIGYNPIFSESLESLFPIWGYFPIPVRDDLILPSDSDSNELSPDTGIFVGRYTSYRSKFLDPIKHKYGWTVLESAHLVDLLPYSIALNLHNNSYRNFENRNFLHMALGHLVLSEPQSPTLDISPGFTHLEFSDVDELIDLLSYIKCNSSDVEQIKSNGRKFVHRYSASNVWGKLLTDMSEILD